MNERQSVFIVNARIGRHAEFALPWKCADHLLDRANPMVALAPGSGAFELNSYTSPPLMSWKMQKRFSREMACIADVLEAASRPVVD